MNLGGDLLVGRDGSPVVLDQTLHEVTRHEVGRKSIRLKYDSLGRIIEEANVAGREPTLLVSFANGDGRPLPYGTWIAIPGHEFEEGVRTERGPGARIVCAA